MESNLFIECIPSIKFRNVIGNDDMENPSMDNLTLNLQLTIFA